MGDNWQNFGVDQSPGMNSDYPFVSPSNDIRFLLGDFWMSFTDDACGFQIPFHVSAMYGFGTGSIATRRDMVIEDANNQVVLDTRSLPYTHGTFGDHLETMQWVGATATLRATRHTGPPPWDPDKTYTDTIIPESARLDARAYSQMPRRVRSIKVGNVTLNGTIQFVQGYNINLTTGTPANVEGGRFQRSLTIRANPGDGTGLVPGCQDAIPFIQRINTVAPTSGGDFTINATSCYRVQRPAAVTMPSPRQVTLTNVAALTFYNDCQPCCTCDDYVNTYRGLTKIWNQFAAIGSQAEAARDQLAANVSRWNDQQACRAVNSLRMTLNAEPYGGLFIAGGACNTSSCCIRPLVLRATLSVLRAGSPITLSVTQNCRDTVRAGTDTQYQEVPYVPASAYPVYDTHFDYADPQAQSRFRTRLAFSGTQPGDSAIVTLSLHSPDTVQPDGSSCGQTVATVPPAVAALWVGNPPPYPTRAILQKVAPISPVAGCGSCT
jgi:hypothetical protein